MSNNEKIAVCVEGLGKRYVVPRRYEQLDKKDSLFSNMKEFFPFISRNESDYFWALRDLSFEVKQGEILGILGHNGSGKSTLLKILSDVTKPTVGRALLRGRVGSLLEVGTGFHPDLTGRENVFMSGVLLGLSRKEIAKKFDEIVDFSGVEKFIDTPVKKYSSGMYVRLAYAVASMLRSDILILDEVLAVGDASFQKKSQENIEKIANEGRTILFVSHNARAVNAICTTGIVLDYGKCIFQGLAKDAVSTYLRKVHHYDSEEATRGNVVAFHDLTKAIRMMGNSKVLRWVSTHEPNGTETNHFKTGQPMIVRIGYEKATAPNPYFAILIQNEFAERVATIHSTHNKDQMQFGESGVIECEISDLKLGEGSYRLMIDYGNFGGARDAILSLECISNAATIRVELNEYLGGIGLDAYQGAVHKSCWILMDR